MPLYNEAKTVVGTLRDLYDVLRGHSFDPVFYIQDDASTDSSVHLIETHPLFLDGKIKLESNHQNLGHGPAVMRAYKRAVEAHSDLVMHVDSDGDIDAESITTCVRAVQERDLDAVIGWRVGRVAPPYRRATTKLLRYCVFVLFGVSSLDVNSPIRVYRRFTLAQFLNLCPEKAVAPHVLLTVMTHKSGCRFSYQPVAMAINPVEPVLGSTWRSSRRIFGLPTRFLRLIFLAASELLRFRMRVKR